MANAGCGAAEVTKRDPARPGPCQRRQQMLPGVRGVGKPMQAQCQRARASRQHPELKTVRPHPASPHHHRGSHPVTLSRQPRCRTFRSAWSHTSPISAALAIIGGSARVIHSFAVPPAGGRPPRVKEPFQEPFPFETALLEPRADHVSRCPTRAFVKPAEPGKPASQEVKDHRATLGLHGAPANWEPASTAWRAVAAGQRRYRA